MQLVPRDVLFDVMRKKVDLSEAEEDEFSFQTICTKARSEYTSTNGKDNDMLNFANKMIEFMKSNMDKIRYVGQGSSRLVFALADGTALKIAKTHAGIAQNKQEAKVCMDPKLKYAIFPDFYGADKQDWLALNCELCAPANKDDFKELLMLQPWVMADLIQMVLTQFKDEPTAESKIKKAQTRFLGDTPKGRFLKQVLSRQTEVFKSMFSLLEFYVKYGLNEMLLGDVEEVDNWGITFRNGQKTLVIIDAGFSKSVADEFYAPGTTNQKNK